MCFALLFVVLPSWRIKIYITVVHGLTSGAVLGIFIWVGQSKAKQILGRPTGVVYMGIMGMTRAVWVGQERVWVGHVESCTACGNMGLLSVAISSNVGTSEVRRPHRRLRSLLLPG